MKIKVSDLQPGPQMDALVAETCMGLECSVYEITEPTALGGSGYACWVLVGECPEKYHPSTNGGQAMELVKEFDVWLSSDKTEPEHRRKIASCPPHMNDAIQYGQTPEVAICRAVITSVKGEYVEIDSGNV